MGEAGATSMSVDGAAQNTGSTLQVLVSAPRTLVMERCLAARPASAPSTVESVQSQLNPAWHARFLESQDQIDVVEGQRVD